MSTAADTPGPSAAQAADTCPKPQWTPAAGRQDTRQVVSMQECAVTSFLDYLPIEERIKSSPVPGGVQVGISSALWRRVIKGGECSRKSFQIPFVRIPQIGMITRNITFSRHRCWGDETHICHWDIIFRSNNKTHIIFISQYYVVREILFVADAYLKPEDNPFSIAL